MRTYILYKKPVDIQDIGRVFTTCGCPCHLEGDVCSSCVLVSCDCFSVIDWMDLK